MPQKTYRVHKRDLDRGQKIEMKEHPQFSPRTNRSVARNHLQRYGPGYYAAEPIMEKIIESKNKQLGATPIKKRPRQKPYNPLTDGLPDIKVPW